MDERVLGMIGGQSPTVCATSGKPTRGRSLVTVNVGNGYYYQFIARYGYPSDARHLELVAQSKPKKTTIKKDEE